MGVMPPVARGEVLHGDASIDLRRGHGGVAEDELDVAHVGAALEEVGRARIPQDVRGNPIPEARGLGSLADDEVESLHVTPAARDRGDEQRCLFPDRR